MLTNTFRSYNSPNDEFDFVHNYYERLVLEEIRLQSERVQDGDRDFMADVACVALNHLPPRYIRHDVDMTFFMSPQEMHEIETKVRIEVKAALTYVESRERGEDTGFPIQETPIADDTGKDKKTTTAKKSKK